MRFSKSLIILIVGALLAVCFAGYSAGRVAPVKVVSKLEDPHKDLVVMVEASMVEIPLSELYSAGMPVISEGGKAVSVEHILECLKKPKSGVVKAGAKLAVSHGAVAETVSVIHQAYYAGPPTDRQLQYQDVGTSAKVKVRILSEDKISVEISFEHSGLDKGELNGDTGDTIIERNWTGSLTVDAGEPTIVGATQDENTGVFLIITVNI
ncbi:MAG: hypothetical protein JW720_02745 [Sedimentisphaerales bacterium]|nr:hypothetical protein [Sedimentisphaerales bacterium]